MIGGEAAISCVAIECVDALLSLAGMVSEVSTSECAVGFFVGSKIFHTDEYKLNIISLNEFCDDAPGTIPPHVILINGLGGI